jgi:hypothetical protein
MNDKRLTERTIKIIENKGRIVIKTKDEMYLHTWCNIAAGPDNAIWTYHRELALEMFNLKWAFTIAPLYNCKVFAVYQKGNKS